MTADKLNIVSGNLKIFSGFQVFLAQKKCSLENVQSTEYLKCASNYNIPLGKNVVDKEWLQEELGKQRERIKSMKYQPLQVPSDNKSTGDEIVQYIKAVTESYERCRHSVS